MSLTLPNTKAYLVNWLGGSCGAFVTTLLQTFVNNKIRINTVSEHGNAHDNLKPVNQNWDTNSSGTYFTNLHFNKDPIHDYIVPKNPNSTIILYDHVIPNWDRLFTTFPKCKNLIVTIEDDDAELVSGNLFVKNTAQYFPVSIATWVDIKNNHLCMKSYDNPNDVSVDDLKTFIQDCAGGYKVEPYYSGLMDYPEQVFTVKMKDIYSNPNEVLSMISEITEEPIEANYIEWYNEYLTKQQELLATKMPWLLDKYPITLLPINNSTMKAA